MLSPFQEKNSAWLQARLGDVDWDIKRALISILETQNGLWRELLAVLPRWLQSRISITQLERSECPERALLQKLEQWSFNVAQLIACFEAMSLDSALLVIKPDADIEIKEDLHECMDIDVGQSLHLACHATGFPTPYYQWYKDDEELLQYQAPNLIVEDAVLEDSGTYYCKVYKIDRRTNCEQEHAIYTRSCTVNVAEPFELPSEKVSAGLAPEIDLQPRSVENLTHGSTIVLECRALGDPPMTYQWFKDNQELLGETHSELHLRHLLPDEMGNTSWKYLCMVENPYGKVVSEIATLGLSHSIQDTLYTAKDKVALLIANEQYDHMQSFTLPSADVATLSRILLKMGFRVMSYLDLTLSEMYNAVHHFCSELSEGTYAFFYFVGHGFEDRGQSYMQPVDAGESLAFEENLCVDYVATKMQNHSPAMNFFLLDMCRERPDYDSNPEMERRPARDYQQKKYNNMIFGYATSFLGEAVEAEGYPNGLFVYYLERHLAKKKSVHEILFATKQDMSQDSLAQKQGQDPVVYYNISEARSLRDPILHENPRKAEYDLKWQEIYRCPEKLEFTLDMYRFRLTFRPHKNTFCNAMDVEVCYKEIYGIQGIQQPIVSLHFRPENLKVEKNPDTSAACFTLRGLQLLKEPVRCVVLLKKNDTGEIFSKDYTFTMPGLAKLGLTRNMLNDSQLYP